MIYGQTPKHKLYPNIWLKIISHLAEVDRYPLKRINKAFYKLNRSLCVNETQESLAKQGLVESLSALSELNFTKILSGACEGAQTKLISIATRYLRTNWYPGSFTNFDHGLQAACRGGHLDIIELMIQEGATNWDMGFLGACQGEHLTIMNNMIKQGVTETGFENGLEHLFQGDKIKGFSYLMTQYPTIVEWSDYFILAFKYEAYKILDLYKTKQVHLTTDMIVRVFEFATVPLITYLIDNYEFDLSVDVISLVCQSSNFAVFQLIKSHFEFDADGFTAALLTASQYHRLDILNKLLDHKFSDDDLNKALLVHCQSGPADLAIVKLLVRGRVTILPQIIAHLCQHGCADCLEFLVPRCLPETFSRSDWDRGLKVACRYNHLKTIDLMIKCGAHPNSGLEEAIKNSNIVVIKHMLRVGADNINMVYKFLSLVTDISILKEFPEFLDSLISYIQTSVGLTRLFESGASNFEHGFNIACDRGAKEHDKNLWQKIGVSLLLKVSANRQYPEIVFKWVCEESDFELLTKIHALHENLLEQCVAAIPIFRPSFSLVIDDLRQCFKWACQVRQKNLVIDMIRAGVTGTKEMLGFICCLESDECRDLGVMICLQHKCPSCRRLGRLHISWLTLWRLKKVIGKVRKSV